MKYTAILAGIILAATTSSGFAAEGPIPGGIPHLDHVFVIMMENHSYSQVTGNPNAPYTNFLASYGNTATNYFAIGHPSLTNYLEVVGGSNFGVQTDNSPDWHNTSCVTNLSTGTAATDTPSSPNICPIWGIGTDAATNAIDTTNEVTGAPGILNIDGTRSIPAASNTFGKTIADQLAERGSAWKSYQESLPEDGADGVNLSDGFFTNNTNFAAITPAQTPALATSAIVSLYAAKHDPFVYFRSVQEADIPGSSFANIVGFDGDAGLYADLKSGNVPAYSFIAPNQCNDQHGRGNAGPLCGYDPNDNGGTAGLNPALTIRADKTLKRIVTAIKASPTWREGQNAIVVVWDENDYSVAPNTNQVLLTVDTNYGVHGLSSSIYYNHFSLLKSIEGGLGLPCLNHACDAGVAAMTDLFTNNESLVSSTPMEVKHMLSHVSAPAHP